MTIIFFVDLVIFNCPKCKVLPKRIYIENLPVSFSESQISDLYSKFGKVLSVKTGRLRGFGKQGISAYVVQDAGADKAISSLNNRKLISKSLNVNEA